MKLADGLKARRSRKKLTQVELGADSRDIAKIIAAR